jgi:two-component system CheB/CheR fusion protein
MASVQELSPQLRMISDIAPVMIWMSGKDQALCFLNKAWLIFTGKERDVETDSQWYECLHPEDVQRWLRAYVPAFTQRAGFTIELRLQRYDGEYRWVSCSGQSNRTSGGQFAGFIGSCVDIHDQKMNEEALERRVSDRTAALLEANTILQQRNNELEQFAYVTSHDLQEPLRKIRIFVDMLQKQEELVGAGKERLEPLSRIRSSADRMAQLIKDLLSYSRLGIADNPFIPTDLNTIVLTALRDFDLLIEETKARVQVMPLPIIEAIPLQMNQLFYNLIGNALKFSRSGVAPVLRIFSQRLNPTDLARYPNLDQGLTYHKIVVQDNGIGFQQEFVDKIFVIFQRLNSKERFPGTGIGLAICRKIVQNHRGEIQAFGKEGEGAEFHLILPQSHRTPVA